MLKSKIKMQNVKSQFKIQSSLTFWLLIFVLFFANGPVFGAEVVIDSKNQEIQKGEQFEATIFLNSEGEYINAIEGKLLFPDELLELKEIRNGNTIINFWVERPRDESGSQIVFSGITPGGYVGEKGLIFSVIFQAHSVGSGIIEIGSVRALLNDGEGSEANVTISNLKFSISKQAPISQIQIIETEDIDPPEPFKSEVAQDSAMFGKKYFLVFATQDKESGIDRYEVCEGRLDCVITESPYLLLNQDLDEKIIVKAIDKSGNERIAILPPPHPLPWYKNYSILAILIVIGAMIIYTLRKVIWRKFTK